MSNEKIEIELDDYLKEHNQGFSQVPNSIIRTKELTDAEYRLWTTLYSYKGEKGIYPSYQTIADSLGISVSKVKKNIKQLVEKDFVEKTRQGFGKSNRYKLKVPKAIIEEYREELKTFKDSGLSKEQIQLIEAIHVIATGETMTEKMIMLVIKEQMFALFQDLHEEKKYPLTKMIFEFAKKMERMPIETEIETLEDLLLVHDEKIIIKAMNKAKRNKKSIKAMIDDVVEKDKLSKEFAKKKAIEKNIEKSKTKDISLTSSYYNEEEEEDLYEKLLKEKRG